MGEMGQEDIDKLLADALGGNDDSADTPMGQDDIDALLAGGDIGGDDDSPMGQDDIDALLAGGDIGGDDDSPMGQDDIDALLAGGDIGGDDDSPMGQDDIDALLAGGDIGGDDDSPMGQDDIDSLLAGGDIGDNDVLMGNDASIDDIGSLGQDDIDALIADSDNIADDSAIESAEYEVDDEIDSMDQNEIDALLTDALENNMDSALSAENEEEETFDDYLEDDFEEPMAEQPAPPPPPIKEEIQKPILSAESSVQHNYSAGSEIRPVAPAPVPQLSKEQLQNIQESLSLSGSAGEVENLAGQMSGLLGQLSERARRFQAAWLTADQETRDLRHAITLNQQKVHVLNGEKQSLLGEIDTLRKQYSQIEGEKLAASEAHRTEIASLELQLREQESRNNMISSEIRSLKEELERARNETTGSDLESRRSRFELERVNNELSSERQERQRLARALENREKELQAMQAQSAGHASTLFLDELHRLVRRLESELDIRTSAAHESLSIIDRMEFIPEQEMYASTLRSTIAAAAGITPDENDALKILDKQSEIKQQSLEPAPPPGEDSFKAAIERYDFAKASGIASAAMRSGEKTPIEFIKLIHNSAVLKRPEVTGYLDDIAAMLRGIKSLQEASDKARGKEGETTEILYVLIFDYLHTLVRMKLISRATTSMWNLFLELRGRFSFLTSDRQWKEYRDRLLSGNKVSVN